jgi:copper chaperone
MEAITILIEGMTCGHCVRAVSQALARVSGVERVVGVELERGQAVVEGTAAAGDLLAAVRGAGYEARLPS